MSTKPEAGPAPAGPDPLAALRIAARGEAARLAALDALRILDTPAEARFDAIVAKAARRFGTPTVLVSLLDAERQWFKARHGFGATETSRDVAFCRYTIRGDAVLTVPDATRDPRFAANPLVTGDPGIRFYAGAPVRSPDGARVGTLCVIDTTPRQDWTAAEDQALLDLAEEVSAEFARRKSPPSGGG